MLNVFLSNQNNPTFKKASAIKGKTDGAPYYNIIISYYYFYCVLLFVFYYYVFCFVSGRNHVYNNNNIDNNKHKSKKNIKVILRANNATSVCRVEPIE